MSGTQIGTVVGGVIGSFFGATQLGMAIGGLIGGAIAPDHLYGPKIGDGQQQSATDGAVIAWVQGTAMIAGTICQVGPRRQIRHKDSGKGGPVTVTYTAVQTFAILVCESSEIRDSTISQILMVLQDGKLVYDVRPGSTMLADSNKWKANVDFLYGDEEQLPHPSLEAITGVGNTPYYRGSCVAVFRSFDVSQAGDRIPTFQFVVSSSGSPEIITSGAFRVPTPTSGQIGGGPYNVVPAMTGTGQEVAEAALAARNLQSSADGGLLCHMNSWVYASGSIFAMGDDSDNSHGTDVGVAGVSVQLFCDSGTPTMDGAGTGVVCTTAAVPAGESRVAEVVKRICLRGGLSLTDIDVESLGDASVLGYPIARQSNAADCLLPLLQAYFGYASEYDEQIHFNLYGADASVTIDRADLIEGNDANEGAITRNLRNQSTEFPRRIVASYLDPAQNYTPVTVASERLATDVVAIGDQSLQIPVVCSADFATKAADKAMKVTYATLEGTQEYSTPFAGSDVYLSIVAGEAVLFQGKRWVSDEVILGNGNIKLTTRYDRQSAYTSNVQAVIGNAPTAPASPYSGPTTLYPMNLPAQRPQDSVGVYIIAAGTDGQDSWVGCNVQVSYDGMETWQNAVQINMEGTIGTVVSNEPTGGEPITVDVLKYDLENATPAQLSALANAFAVISGADVTQLGQFATATETATAKRYDLTGTSRSLGGTTAAPVVAGNRFALMDAAYFLPIDSSFAGRTLYFRGVGFGEVAEGSEIFPLVYTALARSDTAPFVTEDGAYQFTTETGTLALSTE